MHRIQRIRRVAVALAGLAVAWLGLAVAAPAAFARVIPLPGEGGPFRRPDRALCRRSERPP